MLTLGSTNGSLAKISLSKLQDKELFCNLGYNYEYSKFINLVLNITHLQVYVQKSLMPTLAKYDFQDSKL